MKSILVVHPRVSILGGGERVLLHVLNALKNNFEVTLLSEDFDVQAFCNFFGADPSLFQRIRRVRYPLFRPKFPKLSIYQRIVHQRRFEFQFSARYSNSFDAVFSTQDIMYLPHLNAPTLQYCYYPNYFSNFENLRHLQGRVAKPMTGARRLFWRMYYYYPEKEFVRKVPWVSKVISLSNYTRNAVKRVWGVDSEIVPPPCPVNYYSPMKKNNTVITVGRMVPAKRFELFFQIARLVPDYSFIVVSSISEGAGQRYFENVVRMKPENACVILKPLRSCAELIGSARFYVHCMEGEHFGITTVEAMSAGCVPIVHNSGAQPDIIENSGFVWNFPDEAAALIRKITRQEAESLSKRAVQISRRYRPGVFEDRISSIAREMLRSGS